MGASPIHWVSFLGYHFNLIGWKVWTGKCSLVKGVSKQPLLLLSSMLWGEKQATPRFLLAAWLLVTSNKTFIHLIWSSNRNCFISNRKSLMQIFRHIYDYLSYTFELKCVSYTSRFLDTLYTSTIYKIVLSENTLKCRIASCNSPLISTS